MLVAAAGALLAANLACAQPLQTNGTAAAQQFLDPTVLNSRGGSTACGSSNASRNQRQRQLNERSERKIPT